MALVDPKTLLLAAASAAFPSSVLADSLALNGSFEDSTTSSFIGVPGNQGTGIGDGPGPSGYIPFWQDLGPGVTLVRSGAFGTGTVQASHGSQWVSLQNGLFNSGGNGGLQQTLATSAGQTYQLQFDFSAMSDGAHVGDPSNVVSHSHVIDEPFFFDLGAEIAFQPVTIVVDTTGVPQHVMVPWQTATYQFTAVDASTVLRFIPLGPNDGTFFGPGIDNVRITTIPEPAGLCVVGLVAQVFIRRGRTPGR
jgi:hypothetical protein